MIVAFQPGGSIKDARVVLRFGEKLPIKYNDVKTEVFMEGEDSPMPWTLIKPVGETLPWDHPFMVTPEALPPEIEIETLDLTEADLSDSFEHPDIIRDEEEENEVRN